MELLVLGCGDAFGNGGRFNTSFLVSDGDDRVLLDCGASTLIRLKQEKIDLETISTIAISHFHGDHYGGLPFFLISSMFEHPRKSPLAIVGPKGIEQKVVALQEAMYPDTSGRLKDLDLSFYEYQSDELPVGDKVFKAWQVEHSPPSNPHAVRLEWNSKVIAFSGDTSWTDHLLPLSENADVFICECNFLNKVSFGHLSYAEIMDRFSDFNTRQLWLTHMDEEVIEADAFKLNRLSDGQIISI